MAEGKKTHVFLFYLKLGLGALLILIGGVAYLFFRNYSGEKIPYPALWYFAAMAVVAAGTAWVVYTIRREVRREQNLERHKREDLRAAATPVWVDLARCEIVTSTLAEDEITDPHNDSCSVIKFMYEGKPYYSGNIYKDEDTIRLKMELQKQTTLYINPQHGEYYLDTEFLEE